MTNQTEKTNITRYTQRDKDGRWYIEGSNGKLENDTHGRTYGAAIDRLAVLENVASNTSSQMPQKPLTDDLLPCPYCGSGNVVLESYKARKGYEAYVQCNGGCMAMQHTITYDTLEEAEAEAKRLWNTRTKYFSPRDVALMTSAEIEANYDDIVKSMKNWREE